MTFYTDAADDASTLITEFGQTATWSHDNNDGSFNPATGQMSGNTTTAFSAKGVLLDFETNRIDGASILMTDSKLLMEVGSKPEINDVVTVNSIAYQVIMVNEINPAGTPVMYEVQLRK